MQKLITVTINIEKLQESSKGPFTINDVDEINELLQQGWAIEQWEFITGEKETDKAVMLIVLNDDNSYGDFGDEFPYDEDETEGDEIDDADADNDNGEDVEEAKSGKH